MNAILGALLLAGGTLDAVPVRTTGLEHGALFLQIEGVAGWEDGTMAVSDRLARTVTLVDTAGTTLAETTTDRTAAGPAALDCRGEVLAVSAFVSRRVRLYSRQLEAVGEFDCAGPVIDLSLGPDTTVWLAAQTRRGKELLRYDRSGRLLTRVLPGSLTGEAFSDVFLCSCGDNGTVAMAYCVRNLVEIRDTAGVLLRSFTVPGMPPEPPLRTVWRGMFQKPLHLPDGPLIRSIDIDASGALLILGGDYGPHPGRDVYRLDADGRWGTVTLPRRASRIRAGPAGLIIAVDDSKSRIDSYRLRERER